MKFLKYWFPVLLYSAMIFCVSNVPNLRVPLSGFSLDKVFHVGEYVIFGYLLARALSRAPSSILTSEVVFLLVVLGSFVFGLSDEFHQSFVPGRTAGADDLLADLIGGTLGGMFFRS